MAANRRTEKKYLLIVSLDAVSCQDTEKLLSMPFFGDFCKDGTLVGQVDSVFVTNTYPVHATVVTGCHPYRHGVTENTRPSPGDRNPDWYWHAKHIKVPTLYTRAADSCCSTASILWPTTAGAGIKYNVPEIAVNRWWKNQIAVSLRNGSPLLQLGYALKYGRERKGLSQPQLDDFSCSVLCDIIKRKKPNLSMIHFTDVDTHKHHYGIDSLRTSEALKRLDARLGRLFSALSDAGLREQCHILLFGDHSMLEVNKSIHFNRAFEKKGLLKLDGKGRIKSWRAWLKCCGGTAFLYLKDKNDGEALSAVREYLLEALEDPDGGVARFLDEDEMKLSGLYADCPLGVEAARGYEFNEFEETYKANHGYSLKQKDYDVFYAAAGSLINKGARLTGGSLADIAPLALRLLDLPGWAMDGELKKGILKNENTE